jgi:hypothetical protein
LQSTPCSRSTSPSIEGRRLALAPETSLFAAAWWYWLSPWQTGDQLAWWRNSEFDVRSAGAVHNSNNLGQSWIASGAWLILVTFNSLTHGGVLVLAAAWLVKRSENWTFRQRCALHADR